MAADFVAALFADTAGTAAADALATSIGSDVVGDLAATDFASQAFPIAEGVGSGVPAIGPAANGLTLSQLQQGYSGLNALSHILSPSKTPSAYGNTGTNQSAGSSPAHSLTSYTPAFGGGDHISLAGQPTFSSEPMFNTQAPQQQQQFNQLPANLESEIQNAREGGHMVPHYAKGSMVSFQPTFGGGDPSRTQQFTSHLQHPQMAHTGPVSFPVYAEGGEVEEHTPSFYSEGGLGALDNRYVKGDGDGTSDSVPAMLANGEFVIPADVVSSLGNGSNDSGAEVLDKFLHTVRADKQNHKPDELPPDSKGILSYLAEAQKKA